ncbi:MAG: mechanosensitive ion channel [Desulfobacterales bacterium]
MICNKICFRELAICLAFLFSSTLIAMAADNGNTDGLQIIKNQISPESVEKKIEALKTRIQQARLAENEQNAAQKGIPLLELQTRTLNLIALQTNYDRLLTALKKQSGYQEDEALLKEKISDSDGSGLLPPPPFSLTFYDKLIGELSVILQEKEVINLAIKISRRAIEEAASQLESIEKEWRQAKESIETQKEKKDLPGLRWNFEQIELQKNLAETMLMYEKFNHENLAAELRIFDLKQKLYEWQIKWVRKQLTFDPKDLEEQIGALELRREKLRKRIDTLLEKQKKAQLEWLKTEKQAAENASPEKIEVFEAMLAAKSAWRKAYQAALEYTEDMLRLIAQKEQIWKYRNAILQEQTDEKETQKWREELQAQNFTLSRFINLQQNYQTSQQSQIAVLEKQLSEKELNPKIKTHLLNQLKAMQNTVESRAEYITMLLETDQTNQRLLEEIGEKEKSIPVLKKLMTLSGDINKLWEFELWAIDDRPVTFKKIVIALFILVIGILFTKYLLQHITKRLSRITHLQATSASAIQKVLSYLAYLLIILFALRMVNIPLEAFAFLGGAIMIGVGFGAQNLINNFISGFIIMGERPINIGDLIEVEGVIGRVMEIGARCTSIRTGENIDILIPNSSFLEKNITNWTLTNHNIRADITVGVAYGSPVRKVEELLLESVRDQNKILNQPKPFVIFQDFGDNALIFQLYFWIVLHRIIERQMVESDVRFRIDELFREADISIAFPQRDIHLDTQKPLELKMINNPES